MRFALVLSLGVHAILAWAFLTWPPRPAPLVPPEPIAVETVTEDQLAELTSPKPQPDPQPEPDPQADAQSKSTPEPTPAAAPQPAPEPEPAAEPRPEPEPTPRSKPDPGPAPDAAAAPEPKAEPAPQPAPASEPAPAGANTGAPEPSPAPAPPPRKPPSLVAARDAPDPADRPAEAPRTPPSAPSPAASGAPPSAADGAAPASTAADAGALPDPVRNGRFESRRFLANLEAVRGDRYLEEQNPELWDLIQTLRRQVRDCWHLPDPALAGRSLAVDLRVTFDRSGRVTRADIVDVGRTVQDDRFRRVAQSARRALGACSPFDLPADSYALWNRFTLRFVPEP
jgi:hypothetical protein